MEIKDKLLIQFKDLLNGPMTAQKLGVLYFITDTTNDDEEIHKIVTDQEIFEQFLDDTSLTAEDLVTLGAEGLQ